MATITKRLKIGTANELLADVRNAGNPYFEQNVFVYSHRYVAGVDYTAGDNLVVEFDGALEIQFCQLKEILAATDTNLNSVRNGNISGRVGKYITTANTNASSVAVEMFAICRV